MPCGRRARNLRRLAVLMDGDTGRILYAQDENTPRPMASTTKLMTGAGGGGVSGGDLAGR